MSPDRFDEPDAYLGRLCHHMAILVAYEDASLAHDLDRVMLALTFMKAHTAMILDELQSEAARAQEKK